MKNIFQLSLRLSFIFIFGFFILSCSNDDDSNDIDPFEGDFVGSVYFSDDEFEVSLQDAVVHVEKTADTYVLHFPAEIPNLPEMEFEEFNTALLNVDADEEHLVRVTSTTLQVIYTDEEGRTWEANCGR